MPNHVTSHVRIQLNDGIDPEEFLKKIGSEDRAIDFEKIIPETEEVKKSLDWDYQRDGGEQPMDWYNWRCQHWGTKWNAYDANVDDIAYGCIELSFDTAWAPPTPIINALRDMEEVEWVGGNWVEEFCESAGVY